MRKELTDDDMREIIQLYLDKHFITEISKLFHISGHRVRSILLQNAISFRSKEEDRLLRNKKVKQTCLTRYGVEYSFQSNETKEKIKQSCLNKYGTEYYLQSKDSREKSKQTCLERYGVEYISQDKKFKEKIRQTCLEKYGVECISQSELAKEKSRQTCLEKYGVKNPYQSEEIKEKIKQVSLERYGTENPGASKTAREKAKKTCLERYGVENYLQSDRYQELLKNRSEEDWKFIKNKVVETKRKNNTFNTSKSEDLYYEYLLSLYSEDDIVRQYSSEVYPFACDFYIKSQNLYIECNYSWVHGPHPFDKDDEEDQKLLEKWVEKSKNSNYYKNAIKVWTDSDVKKQQIAKENNLNYVTLY